MKLYKINDRIYILNYKDRKAFMIDGIDELFIVSKRIEIPMDEMELAVLSMSKNNHNYAEFGEFRRTFMFSEKV